MGVREDRPCFVPPPRRADNLRQRDEGVAAQVGRLDALEQVDGVLRGPLRLA